MHRHTHSHTDTHTDTRTDTHINTHTFSADKHAHRHTQTDMHRHTHIHPLVKAREVLYLKIDNATNVQPCGSSYFLP